MPPPTPTPISTPLPTPRHLLTSLLKTLMRETSPPLFNPHPNKTESHPLKNLPPSQRALLTTLHVLFPPPMLLQALDLLDRGLVVRVILEGDDDGMEKEREGEGVEVVENEIEDSAAGVFGGEGGGGDVPPTSQREHPPDSDPNTESRSNYQVSKTSTSSGSSKKPQHRHTIYQVRSSQPARSRFHTTTAHNSASTSASSPSNAGAIYTVHLPAWNCSCAAFVFSAFPPPLPSSSNTSPYQHLQRPKRVPRERAAWSTHDREGWQFGGLSLDGDGSGHGNVPICKHLLACLLAEKWEGVLGGYVKERVVGGEEMAGVGGEG